MESSIRVIGYFFGVIAILVLLAWAPRLWTRTHFRYQTKVEQGSAARFPQDWLLRPVDLGGRVQKAVRLGDLLKESPNGVLVNFWATWCAPCLEELPNFELYDRQSKAKGATALPRLVTVSVDESVSEIRGLIKTLDFRPGFILFHDPEGALAEKVGTARFPETYWVGQDGIVRKKWLGPQNWLSDGVLRQLAGQ